MAKKSKKLNTDLDDSVKNNDSYQDEDITDEGFSMVDEEEQVEDDVMYTMGEIIVDDSTSVEEVNEDKQILQNAVKKTANDEDDDANEEENDSEVWIDTDALEDEDPFLEEEDFDPDEVYD